MRSSTLSFRGDLASRVIVPLGWIGKPLPSAPIDHLLAMVFDAYQADAFPCAEALCREILAQRPHHLDATHLLAVLAARTGRTVLGERLLNEAVALVPR